MIINTKEAVKRVMTNVGIKMGGCYHHNHIKIQTYKPEDVTPIKIYRANLKLRDVKTIRKLMAIS